MDVKALVGGQSMPQPVLLLMGEFQVGLEDGEVVAGGAAAAKSCVQLVKSPQKARAAALVNKYFFILKYFYSIS